MTTGFKSYAEVISFAINRENEAKAFYLELARQAEDPFMREIFGNFAQEEIYHQNRLENIGTPDGIDRLFRNITSEIEDRKLAEALEPVEATPEMDFRDVLIVAMKREEKSKELYSLLAELSEDDEISLLFLGLAKEELHHKKRIETAYQELYGDQK